MTFVFEKLFRKLALSSEQFFSPDDLKSDRIRGKIITSPLKREENPSCGLHTTPC